MPIPTRNVPQAIARVPILQYSSGHTRSRAGSTGSFSTFVGFHSEIGKDTTFDEACHSAGIARIEIRHGSGDIKSHWLFGEHPGLYPLTTGPVATTMTGSLSNGNARRTADAGIGALWVRAEKSRAAFRGYLAPLVKVGWCHLVQLAVSSRMTDALITTLCDHTRVCQIADELVDRGAHPSQIGLYELLLPLGAGQEITSGNGTDQVQLAPLISGHPAEVERSHIRSIWRPLAVLEAAERDWASVVAWAHDYAAGGQQGEESE